MSGKRNRKSEQELPFEYDESGILGELEEGPVEIVLDEELRGQVLSGQRRRRLKNVTIKLAPAQIVALRKIAVMKSIPYQTLVRHWLAEGIKRELGIG